MEYIVRKATVDDCHTLASFLQRLVDLRNEPGLITQNASDLKKDGFSSSSKFAAFLAEVKENGKVETVGIAIYSYRYFSFVGTGLLLNNLFVLEPHRGRGIASKLLRVMSNEGLNHGIHNMCFMSNSWNRVAKSLYSKMDAVDLTESKGLNAFELVGKSVCKSNHGIEDIMVRKAMEADVPKITKMLREFTKSQNCLVKNVSEDVIREDGFRSKPKFKAFVAVTTDISENGPEVVGVLTYSYSYCSHSSTTIFIDSIYVKDDYRRQGVACALFNALQEVELPKGRTKTRTIIDCKSTPLVRFLNHVGAIDQSENAQWVWFWVDEEDLKSYVCSSDQPHAVNGKI